MHDSVKLHVQPKTAPMSWDAFVAQSPGFSIALDGFVADGPRREVEHERGPYANFNHHEHCDRLATHATCGQVLMAIRQGLFSTFRDEHGPVAHIFVNDCDEDVCLAVYLLRHGHIAEHTMNPLLNRLVAMEDALDATAGAYPFPKDLPTLKELAWVFEPYRRCRLSGIVDSKSAAAHLSIIEDVGHRIAKHVVGEGGKIPLDTSYERVGGGPGWAMIKEIGGQARTGAFADGIRAYVAVRERLESGGGLYTYTVGRMSGFIRFPVPALLDALNEAEASILGVTSMNLSDRWGGGDTIGGSPRVRGSALPPDAVAEIVNEVLGVKA